MEFKEKIEGLKTQGELQKVTVHGSAGEISEGEVVIKNWTPKQRKLRALKFLIGCWSIAVITILIPIAHFILVPLFFVLGPIIASSALNQKSIILGGWGICPFCGKEFEIVKNRNVWPVGDICNNCNRHVTLEK